MQTQWVTKAYPLYFRTRTCRHIQGHAHTYILQIFMCVCIHTYIYIILSPQTPTRTLTTPAPICYVYLPTFLPTDRPTGSRLEKTGTQAWCSDGLSCSLNDTKPHHPVTLWYRLSTSHVQPIQNPKSQPLRSLKHTRSRPLLSLDFSWLVISVAISWVNYRYTMSYIIYLIYIYRERESIIFYVYYIYIITYITDDIPRIRGLITPLITTHEPLNPKP